MFKELFLDARDYLNQRGFKATLIMGVPVTEAEISAVDSLTDFPMSLELKRFYSELGDGFEFRVEGRDNDCDMVGWEPMRLADHQIANTGFGQQLEEEALRELGRTSPRVNEALLKKEVVRRKQWMPFYGFAGGGNYLCLDLSMTPHPVCFYEALVWPSRIKTWDFILAHSFTDFVQRWSRFHYLTPSGEWTSFCQERTGQFDWDAKYFPPAFF